MNIINEREHLNNEATKQLGQLGSSMAPPYGATKV